MATEKIVYTNEDTIALIKNRSQSNGDNFRIKIFRRKGTMGFLEHIATADQARVVHVANPEMWISKLAGGGSYALQVYPAEDPTLSIGGNIVVNVNGVPRDPDVGVVGGRTWDGPGVFPYPEPAPVMTDPFAAVPSISVGSSPVTSSHAAPQTNVPGGVTGGGLSPFGDPMAAYFRQQEEKLAALTAKLDEERRQARAALDEERRKLAEEKMRLDFEAKSRALEEKIATLNVQRTEPKGPGVAEIITGIGTVFAPIVMQILKSGEENRALMFKAQQDGQQQFQTLITTLMSKKDMDPSTQMLVNTLSTLANRPPDEGMSRMIEAMSAVSGTSLQMMQTLAEIQLASAPPEHPGMLAVKEIAKALGAMSRAGALKPKTPQVRPAAGPASVPQPVLPAQGQPQAAFAGVPANAAGQSNFEVVLDMIHQRADVKIVAARLVNMLKNSDPSLVEQLKQFDDDLQALAGHYLGPWAMAEEQNGEYLANLFKELQAQGSAAGVLSPMGEEPEPGDDEPADDDQPDDE